MSDVTARSRIRVLTLALDAGSGYGGAERLAFDFALRLDHRVFESVLCTIRAPLPGREAATAHDRAELAAAGVKVIDLGQRSRLPLRVQPWRTLYSLLSRERFQVVHAHMPRASVPGSLIARIARVPVVVSHEHGSLLEGKVIRPLLDRQVVGRFSDRVLAVSEYDRQQLVRRAGLPPARVEVLPNGIPAPRVARPTNVQAEFGLQRGWPVIGSVGRLFEQKGYDYLVAAIAVLKERGRRIHCLIAGAGPEEAALRQQISDLGVQDEVRLIGRRTDVPALVRAFDVAVLSSRWEGSPLALIEYMAAGAPIVAPRVGGIPELVVDSVHGVLVNPEDPEQLAEAIERLLDDREFASRIGEAAQVRQRAEFDLDVVVRRLEALYLRLLGLGDSRLD